MHILHHIQLFLLLATISQPADSAGLNSMLIEKLQENQTSLAHGSFDFYVERKYPGSKYPVKLRGNVQWNQDDIFWAFRCSDPDKMVHPSYAWAGDLSEAKLEYMLITQNQLLFYNASNNSLHIYPFGESNKTIIAGFELYNVLPRSNWYICHAPYHTPGMPWSDLISPTSRALQPDSTVSLVREGNKVTYQRKDKEKGQILTVCFDLDQSGNVVNFSSEATDSRRRREGKYHWSQNGDTPVLNRYEFALSEHGSVVETYTLTISNFRSAKPGAAVFSIDRLKALLPRDLVISNHITNKVYFANPSVNVEEKQVDSLIDAIKGGSLFKH